MEACTYCLGAPQDPLTTPCGHAFCAACVEAQAVTAEPGSAVLCPNCRADFTTLVAARFPQQLKIQPPREPDDSAALDDIIDAAGSFIVGDGGESADGESDDGEGAEWTEQQTAGYVAPAATPMRGPPVICLIDTSSSDEDGEDVIAPSRAQQRRRQQEQEQEQQEQEQQQQEQQQHRLQWQMQTKRFPLQSPM